MSHEIIWLTGCASGVGLHLTNCFAGRGYRVVATDINLPALESHAKQNDWDPQRVLVRKLNVTRRRDWNEVLSEVLEHWGKVDRLLNVAGYLRPGYVHETNDIEVDRHLDINLKGLIYGSQIVARQMVQQHQGHIINIASAAALAAIPGIALYSTAKFGVRAFSLALAQELKPHGVKVTVICPDAIQTPMLTLQEDYEEAALTFSGPAPLTVSDIEAVIFEEALTNMPMEITLPWHRGALAKLGNAFPGLSNRLVGVLRKKGLKAQQQRKASKATGS